MVTIFATCGYTRLVIKQTASGLYYYVKTANSRHWHRIHPSEVLDYVPSISDCTTEVWAKTKLGWQYTTGIPLEIIQQKKQKIS